MDPVDTHTHSRAGAGHKWAVMTSVRSPVWWISQHGIDTTLPHPHIFPLHSAQSTHLSLAGCTAHLAKHVQWVVTNKLLTFPKVPCQNPTALPQGFNVSFLTHCGKYSSVWLSKACSFTNCKIFTKHLLNNVCNNDKLKAVQVSLNFMTKTDQ